MASGDDEVIVITFGAGAGALSVLGASLALEGADPHPTHNKAINDNAAACITTPQGGIEGAVLPLPCG